MNIAEYVMQHTERGECKCGKCIDRGDRPDPEGHTVDMVFFQVARVGEPTLEEFRRLTHELEGEFGPCDPFDGQEHGYMELGGWIGDQGLAMQYMGLGTLLGAFKLFTPRIVPGLPEDMVMEMAGMGLLSVSAKLTPAQEIAKEVTEVVNKAADAAGYKVPPLDGGEADHDPFDDD